MPSNPMLLSGRVPQDQNRLLGLIYSALTLGALKLGGPRSGVLVDEGGIARPVLTSEPKNTAAGSTDESVVAAVAGMKIRVLSVYALAGSTATNLTFNTKPAGAGSAISALLANGANGGEVLPFSPHGHMKDTVAGQGLSVTTGSGATTGLQVKYILVPDYLTDENGQVLLDETGTAMLPS